jgi:hypothetical protein
LRSEKREVVLARKGQDSLKKIVGSKVYSVWVDMLRRLVPEGRTHRLAPTIAAMLQYALEVAEEKYGGDPEEGSLVYLLCALSEEADDETKDLLLPVVERLLEGAGVKAKRKSARGIEYSIAEAALQEFINWYSMPWES